MTKELKLVIDNNILDKYNEYYFKNHPKAKKKPIERPIHESINKWMIMQRMSMNALKQKWCDFGTWFIKSLGYENMSLEEFDMHFTSYMPTKRRADPDNYVPKFLLDSFTNSGFIVDDDGRHLKTLSLSTDYDKDNPRTEIDVTIYKGGK